MKSVFPPESRICEFINTSDSLSDEGNDEQEFKEMIETS
jgi:hypothetical protein